MRNGLPRVHRWLRALSAAALPGNNTRWAKVFLNTECNLRCPYCAVPSLHKSELPLEDWTDIYRSLRQWGVTQVSILGGEPTLRGDLVDHVFTLARLGILTSITTNGRGVSATTVSALAAAGLDCLQVSLDTLGTSRLPKRDAHNTFQILSTAKSLGVLPIVSAVITSRNVTEVPTLAMEVIDRGFFFSFSPYQDIAGQFSRRVNELHPHPEQLSAVACELKRMKEKTRKILNTHKYLDMLSAAGHWRCSENHDLWVAIDSEGFLMRCHEHKSPFKVRDISTLKQESWDSFRRETVRACKGCSFHCYYDAEQIGELSFLRDSATILACLTHIVRLGRL